MKSSIGANIKQHRVALGWSQADAAQKLKISTPAFCKIETDQTDLNISRLQQIAKLFKVSVNQLIDNGDQGVSSSVSNEEVIALKKELMEREEEMNKLRKKVIDLYDKLGL